MAKIQTTRVTTVEGKQDTYNSEPPAGAKILSRTVTTSSEAIENGWLITKEYNGKYVDKGRKDSDYTYFNYTKKWYSKVDPFVNAGELADNFEEEE